MPGRRRPGTLMKDRQHDTALADLLQGGTPQGPLPPDAPFVGGPAVAHGRSTYQRWTLTEPRR
eukprot:6778643-Lingulodinium_polyedra.AAC.1